MYANPLQGERERKRTVVFFSRFLYINNKNQGNIWEKKEERKERFGICSVDQTKSNVAFIKEKFSEQSHHTTFLFSQKRVNKA